MQRSAPTPPSDSRGPPRESQGASMAATTSAINRPNNGPQSSGFFCSRSFVPSQHNYHRGCVMRTQRAMQAEKARLPPAVPTTPTAATTTASGPVVQPGPPDCKQIALSTFDLASLSGLVGESPEKFQHCFCQAMFSIYKVDQLKAIIRYIRDLHYKQRLPVPRLLSMQGRKQLLVEGLVEFVQNTASNCPLHSSARKRASPFNYLVDAVALKECSCYPSDEAARNAAAIADAAVLKALSEIPDFRCIDGLYADIEVLSTAFLRGSGAIQLQFKMDPQRLLLVQSGAFRIFLRRFCPNSSKYEVIDNRMLIRVNGQTIIVPPQQFESKKNAKGAAPLDISAWIRNIDQHIFVSSHVIRSVVTVQFVRVLSLADAIESIKKKDEIPESVASVLKDCDDDDVRPSNMLVSLRCPLSMIRMKIPAKATTCNHQQCFDLESVVTYCKQYNKWTCPICCSPIRHQDIRIDSFFKRVLAGAGPDTEQANIGVEGSIQYIDPEDERRKQEALEERIKKRRRVSEASADIDEYPDPVVGVAGSSYDCPFVID